MIRYPEGQKQSSRVSFEKDVMTRLIEQLPAFDYFEQYFDYSVTNYLPYRWAGFKQQTYFSYILPDLSDVNAVFDGFRSNIKTDIRKAEQSVSVEDVDDLDRFYALLCMSYGRQQRKPAVSIDLLRRIDEACKARGQRSIFIAIDAEGRPHAGAYIVWDERSAYYLLGGGDPQLRNSGATSLVLWHAIRFCAERTVRFDFEGSVHEPIERYFRAFGGVQTPYHKIYKENAFLLKLRSFVRGR
jgi:lipid II:glycine glycyltransferase (peptidoglycan interpeptide bridge formation enzyme)